MLLLDPDRTLLTTTMLSIRALKVFLDSSFLILNYFMFLYIFLNFLVSPPPWNDENNSFYRINQPRASGSQKEANLKKILITGATTSASQCRGTEFLIKTLCTSGAMAAMASTTASAFCLQISAFINLAPNHLVFIPIAISYSYTYKITKLS